MLMNLLEISMVCIHFRWRELQFKAPLFKFKKNNNSEYLLGLIIIA